MWTVAAWIFPPCRDFQRFQSCLAAASWQQSHHFSPFPFSQNKGPRSLQVARSQQSCRHGSEQQALTLPAHIPSPMAPASPFPPCHPQPPLLAPYLLPIPCLSPLFFPFSFCPPVPWFSLSSYPYTHGCLHVPSIAVVVAFITLGSLLMPHVLL